MNVQRLNAQRLNVQRLNMQRCDWVNPDDALLLRYHDLEWGVPVHDDNKHFEFLVLEAAQAGLSWLTVLRKREGYRRAFSGFDHGGVANTFSSRGRTSLGGGACNSGGFHPAAFYGGEFHGGGGHRGTRGKCCKQVE
jgi:hypothetical protein